MPQPALSTSGLAAWVSPGSFGQGYKLRQKLERTDVGQGSHTKGGIKYPPQSQITLPQGCVIASSVACHACSSACDYTMTVRPEVSSVDMVTFGLWLERAPYPPLSRT